MLVLGIDTTTQIASVGLYDSEKGFLGETNIFVKTNHSNVIMSMINDLMLRTSIKITEIDKIAVSIGPGSFTGIRIGVAIAKGLAYGKNKKIVGINELEMLANLSQDKKNVAPLIDARRERVYGAFYQDNKRIIVDSVGELNLFLDEISKTIDNSEIINFVGDGALSYKDIIKAKFNDKAQILEDINSFSRAIIIAKMGIDREDNLYKLEPFYVNKSQAEREMLAKKNK